ncbi:elongation factor 4 [Candidatus Saccharibacteria bacterium RIFCSPHIGHO2_12_FULL_48_21]|nr:MAG: elongation factor 4 [Candidatus Saccharibacteria bacterium RIFCSPHIGHO2_12_FULL_48_21]
MTQERIRNFCIIAHIDHGKSTLADRMLELTHTIEKRQMKAQVLDRMELERERGITIKLAPVRMNYQDYQLNLIDTPGHVDFSYEVSRSLAAVEGAVLVVDASQGIQAQTIANVYLALAANLKIIPVLNKIDLPAADVNKVSAEVVNLLGGETDDILTISAKTGQGVEQVLQSIISDVPPPSGKADGRLRGLIFDSYYDEHRGVILYVRIVDGRVKKSASIKLLATGAMAIALEVGSLRPDTSQGPCLESGEIGYIITNLKSAQQARVGDTITLTAEPVTEPLPGYKEVKPFVYAGFYPKSNEQYHALKEAIQKLSLSDSSLQAEPEKSPVLGFGMRLGFLGMLHLDIVQERLSREYGLELIITNPSTDYRAKLTDGTAMDVKAAAELPDESKIEEISEPWVRGEIVVPKNYVGAMIGLISDARGEQKHISYVDSRLAVIDFEAPLSKMLTDFYDQLKSASAGYGTFNYELADYRQGDLVKLDFYVAGDKLDVLAIVAHRAEADRVARDTLAKLKDVIPRQQFGVSLQAAIGGQFIAREDISAFRKDVTSGLYGGDVTRKKKVLAKQKKGKERLKRFGKVDIPAEAFSVMMKRN